MIAATFQIDTTGATSTQQHPSVVAEVSTELLNTVKYNTNNTE